MARLLKYKMGVGRRLLAFLIAMLLMTSYINIISPFISFAEGEDIITETESQKITNFSVHLVSGAKNNGTDDNSDYVWVATKHDAEHRFVYQMDYDLSGEGFLEPNTVQFVIPKYIIKDRNNNWANNYELAIPINTDVPEDDNENIFVYKEDGNNILVYNRLQVSAAEKGSIQFAYDTNKSMLDYVDMRPSEILYAEFNIDKNVNEHLHTVDDITRVKIDTTATIGSSSQSCELYETWKSSWGNASDFGISNPNNYYYLYWTITTNESFVTQPYTFRINSDTVNGSNGNADFVAVRMKNSGAFSQNFYDSSTYRLATGEVNHYIITKHLKSAYQDLDEYNITNSTVISLHPIDNIDNDTQTISSGNYKVKPTEDHTPIYPINSLSFIKSGVNSSSLNIMNNPANYELNDFMDGAINDIHSNMTYNLNMSADAYSFTLANDSNIENIESYGQKPIKYTITDEDFYLNDSITDDSIRNNTLPNDLRKLNYNDFEITSFNYDIIVQSASWVDYRFIGRPATSNDFENNNTLDFYAKFGSNNNWIKIGSKNMKTNAITKDNNYVKYFSGNSVEFKDNVLCVGIKVETSNKLYSTNINIIPQCKLKKSDYVRNTINTAINNNNEPKIWMTNKANCTMSVDNKEFFNSDKYARNIIVGYTKVSNINKKSSFVQINKVKKLVTVGWQASISESYMTQNGLCYVKQNSGKFYDLLPTGADVDRSTIVISTNEQLKQSDYDVQTIPNYKGSGRTLMIVNIKVPTESTYTISYSSIHSIESLYDYGVTIRNTLAYETGNDVIANGYPDNGGTIIDADLMNDLDSFTDDNKFIYTDSSRVIELLFAVSSGLTKMVKAHGDIYFKRNTSVHENHLYTYRLRYANDFSTRAKNMVFYDNIENYTGSVWQGELQSIDVSQIKNKGVSPIIYLSDKNVDIGVSANRNLNNDSIWTTIDNFDDISKAKSIAIDLSKKDDNSEFVLNQSESVVILLNMLSPDTDPGESLSSDKIPAKALNSVYLDSAMMKVFPGQTYNHNLLHWNNDIVEFKTMGDILLSKVDARDNITPVKDISFSLIGVSDYGTTVNETKESDVNGLIDFKDIEKGSYTLTETSGSKDYQKINETINVVINADGSVSYNGETLGKNSRFVISDEPRIHTDIKFTKRDITNKNKRIAGVKFHLYGTSEYNNFVSKTAISDNYGNVVFEDIELGHYELEELTVADGYIEDNSIYKVFINEQGKYSIDGSIMEKDGTLSIYNEPYHSFTIQKESFTEMEGIAMPVEGAVFILVGNSDRGTSVNMTRTSGANGKLTFSGLESGYSYILKEIEAPDGYAIDDVEHIVKITKNGNITISGLNKNSYGEFVVKDKEDSTVTVTKKWVDNETNETRTVEPKIHLGVNESVPVAYFGSNLPYNTYYGNSVLNLLTSSNIKAFKPFNGIKSEAISAFKSNTSRCIDDGTTDYRIYAWYISDSSKPDYGTVYWWSDAKVVYLTDKSHELFSKLSSVRTIDVSGIDVSKVTDMSNMFYNDYSLNNIIGLDNWDVSNVTNMAYMFYYCSYLTSIESLKNWNTSNVTDMQYMFCQCPQLTSIEPLENWDVSSVTNMQFMFSSCSQLTSLKGLENWDTSNVTDMKYMFYQCSQLTSIEPLENWDVSSVTNMQYMFSSCSQLTSLKGLENWGTSNVTNMQYMFYYCNLINHIDLHNWDISNVNNMSNMFAYCSQLVDININNWNGLKLQNIQGMFYNCQKLEYIYSENWIAQELNNITNIFYHCNLLKEVDVSNWNTENVTSLDSLFKDCKKLQSLNVTNWDVSNVINMCSIFGECYELEVIEGLENWNVSNVTNMQGMFNDCLKLTSLNALSDWDVSNVTNMQSTFGNCYKLTSLSGLEDWDVSNVTDMSNMFYRCNQLTSLDALSNWDVSNVTDMSNMFYNCNQLTSIDGLSDWDVSNVTNMAYMFYNCNQLTSLSGLEDWDTSSVTNMSNMFYNCRELLSFDDIQDWNTSSLTNISGTFSNCSKIKSFNFLLNWDKTNITNMSALCAGCSSIESFEFLKYIDVSNTTNLSDMFNSCSQFKNSDLEYIKDWDVSNITSMQQMFFYCNQLTSLDGLENWDTSSVISMYKMFSNCYNLTSAESIEHWDVSNVTDIGYMFYYCTKLESIDLSYWDVSNVTDIGYMFYYCTKLESINLSNWNINNINYMRQTFYGCSNLVSIYTTDSWNKANTLNEYSKYQTFYDCTKLNEDGISMRYDPYKITGDYAKIGSNTTEGYFRQGIEHEIISSSDSNNSNHLVQLSTGKAYFYTRYQNNGSNYNKTYITDWGNSSSNFINNIKVFRKYTGDLTVLEDLIASNKARVIGISNDSNYKIYGWVITDTSADDYGTAYWWSNAATVALRGNARGLFSCLTALTTIELENIDVSEVTDFSCMFENCYNITTLDFRNWVGNSNILNTSKMFYGCSKLETIQGLDNLNVQNVTNMQQMFYDCQALTSINALSNWDTSSVTNMQQMFCDCRALTSINALLNWDVSNVTDMSYMFYNCHKLTSLDALSNWDVSNVTNMRQMFYNCQALTSINVLSNWDVSNVINMQQMFCNCQALTSINALSNWDVSNVTNMSYMFGSCSQLTSLDALSNWGVSNVTNMQGMFSSCSQLSSINALSNWDVSNVTNMSNMFSSCSQLSSIDTLSNWDTSNVNSMSDMFYNCIQLTSLSGLENWDTSSVNSMSHMFYGCTNIIDLTSIANWDVSNVKYIDYLFYNCHNLKYLDLSKWKFNNLMDLDYLFYECNNLKELDVSDWNTTMVSSMEYVFYWCINLEKIKGLETWNTINVTSMYGLFYNCPELSDINISNWNVDNLTGSSSSSYYAGGTYHMFYFCSNLKTLDLSSWAPVKLYRTDYMFYYCENLETIYVSDLWDLSNCSGSSYMFYYCNKLTGEKGTKYDDSKPYDKTYAHIDRLGNPGYLTYKKPTPKNIVEVYDSTDERCQLEKATDDNWYYTFTELDPSLDYYTWEDEMENYTSVNMTKSRAVGVVDGTATITNKATVNPLTFGSLKISKNILNNDGTDTITSDDASKQFLFIISFVDGEDNIPPDNIYDIVKSHDGVESTTKLAMIDGKLQLLLSDNDIAMIRDIPTGYKYTITEALDDKFTMSVGSGALTGTITENKVSTTDILNTKVPEEVEEFVTFKLKKVVVGNYIDASEKFTFSLNFTGLKPNEIYNIISNKQSTISYKANKNGVGFAEVELVDGEELTITVPKDSVYAISESGGNYISSYKIIDNAGLNLITKSYDTNFKKNQELSIQSETADLNEDIEITFTNKKLETQKLTLQKELINVSPSNSDMFDFTVEITDLEDGTQISSSLGTLTAEDSNEIVVQFPLAANTPVEFYNIPVNAKYKITEAASDYIASYKIYDTEHNELESGANTEVNKALETGARTVTKDVDTSVVYTNRKVSCDITIRKEIDMTYGILTKDKYRYTPFTFDISLTGLTKPLNQIDVQYLDDSITGVITKKLSQVLGITDESANEVRSNVNLTVELFNGQAIKIKDMPKNATCSVKERASDNYIASYKVRGNDAAVIQAHDTANDVKNMELSMDVAEVVDDEDTDIVITFTNQYEFPPYELPAAGMNNYWYVLYGVAFVMLILTLAYTYSSYKRRQEI